MNQREEHIAEKYRKEDWKILRGGAPDFIMLKVKNNEIIEMMAVEVKSETDRLTYEQMIWKDICKKAGIPYKVEVVE